MSFIEEFAKLKSVLSDSSTTCYFRTVFALLLSTTMHGLYEPYLLLTNGSCNFQPSFMGGSLSFVPDGRGGSCL